VGASAPSLPALQVVAVSKRAMPRFCPWRASVAADTPRVADRVVGLQLRSADAVFTLAV